jgi:DNA primase
VVREYYKADMRNRLNRLRRPEGSSWRHGLRRPWRNAGQEPAPAFPAGLAARRDAVGPDEAHQELALLGALIERPALLHALAEETAGLPIASPELDRLRRGLLDALSLSASGVDPAADEALAGDVSLEGRLITEHLRNIGLGRLAMAARAKALKVFQDRPGDAEAWIEQWRGAAQRLAKHLADLEELSRAEQDLANDLCEENLQRVQAVSDRIRRESLDQGPG